MNNYSGYSVIRDHVKGLMWAGKFITIHTKDRPMDMYPGINGLGFPVMKVPRIEIYYPLLHGDTRDDVIAHECAHFYYADMRLDKFELEMEAIKIIESVEKSIFDFYWDRPDLGEECVVRLADFRRQGRRLPRMSPRLSAVTRTLAAPKPFRVGMWGLALLMGLSSIVLPLSGVLT